MPEPAPRPAPLWRRASAVGINLAMVGCGFECYAVSFKLFARGRNRQPDSLDGQPETDRRERLAKVLGRYGPALAAMARVDRIRYRDRRSVGHRVLGLRTVDIRTGGPPSLAGVVRIEICGVIVEALQSEFLTAQVAAIQRPQEQEGQRGCMLMLAAGAGRLLTPLLTIPFTVRRQTLGQIIAGTMTLRDAGDRSNPASPH